LGKSYVPKLPKAVIEYEVRDKNGKLLSRGKLPAKSWVGNIIGLLSSLIYGGTCPSTGGAGYPYSARADMTATDGASQGITIYGISVIVGGNAGAGIDTYGILIGSSDTPVAIGQYILGSKIAHGTSSGQMSYGTTTVEALTKDTTWQFRVVRTFTNNSGATITVRELGLFIQVTNPTKQVMLARDVLPSPVTVPNGSTLTVRYIISHSLA
jgi:hypothetical protein